MAVSLRAGRLEEPRGSRSRRTRLPGASPARARNTAAVDSVLLGICVGVSLIATLLPSTMRDRAATELRRTVASPLASLERWSQLHRAAFLSYDARVAAQGTVTRDGQELTAIRSENERLRGLLGLASRMQWGFVTAEAVPNQQASELGNAQTIQEFKITVGTRAGVTPFTPVVATAGLVGMVQQVDPVRSQVISYAHPDFRVSAQADSAYGIVQPHLGTGADRGLLELHGVAFRSPLKVGQVVSSSGLGGTYPAGIPIGTVIREIQTPEKWARTYLLQPAVNLAEVGPVMLILRQRAERGLDSVWTSVHAVEVNARRVAAAGDSIARTEQEREAAARRAALDSVRADSIRRDGGARDTTPRFDASDIPGAVERRLPESRPTEPRPTEPRAPEPRAPEPRAEPRPTDTRPADARTSDTRATEPRSAESRPTESRTATAREGAATNAPTVRPSSTDSAARRRPPRPTVPVLGAGATGAVTAPAARTPRPTTGATRTRGTDSTARRVTPP